MTIKPSTALDFIAKSVYEIPYFGAFSIDAFLYQTFLLFLYAFFLALPFLLFTLRFHYGFCLFRIGDSEDFGLNMRLVERHSFDFRFYYQFNPIE